MKILIGLIFAIVVTLVGTTEEAHAYYLGNSTPVVVNNVFISTSCGPIGPFNLLPNTVINVPIPVGCVVTGVIYQGLMYAIGFNGPVPPPNPPNRLVVTTGRAVFTI